MASVPVLIVGAFFLVVGLLLMTVSMGEGLVVVFLGVAFAAGGVLWGLGGDRDASGPARVDFCPRCGRTNDTGSVFCSGCGFYLPLPA